MMRSPKSAKRDDVAALEASAGTGHTVLTGNLVVPSSTTAGHYFMFKA